MVVDRVCPLLALVPDGRSVVDGYDPEHHCLALTPPPLVDRVTQLQLCLHEGHAECSRFREYQASRAADQPVGRPAADVAFIQTRLVLGADALRDAASPPRTRSNARRLLAGAAVVVVVAAGAFGFVSTHGYGLLAEATQSPDQTRAPAATGTPLPTATPAATPAATVTPEPSPTPTPTPAPTATPAPTQRVYIVQSGDTLNGIAARFGTTVDAILQANPSITDASVITVGQRIVIP